MKAAQLLKDFRIAVDDDRAPYLFSDEFLLAAADQAQREAARRARIIRDAANPEVCVRNVGVGESFIQLHPSVLRVTYAQLEYPIPDEPEAPKQIAVLGTKTRNDMDTRDYNWRNQSSDPTIFIPDVSNCALRFNNKPLRAATLRMEVERMPLGCITKPESAFEIPWQHVPDLVHWLKFKAYSRKDADTEDPAEATRSEAEFERIFGPPTTAVIEQHLQHRRGKGQTHFM